MTQNRPRKKQQPQKIKKYSPTTGSGSFHLSGLSVHGVATAAVDMYLALAAGYAQVLVAAGTLEKHIILALAASALGGGALTALLVQILEIDVILHLPLLQLAGKGADKGHYQHKGAEEEKQ